LKNLTAIILDERYEISNDIIWLDSDGKAVYIRENMQLVS
jgi:hypothetical protein